MYGPLHLAFPGDVPYACTNIQRVAEEEEGEEGDIHIMEVDMMEFRMYKGCYPLSYDMIDICAQGGQIRRWHTCACKNDQLILRVFYDGKEFGNILS